MLLFFLLAPDDQTIPGNFDIKILFIETGKLGCDLEVFFLLNDIDLGNINPPAPSFKA